MKFVLSSSLSSPWTPGLGPSLGPWSWLFQGSLQACSLLLYSILSTGILLERLYSNTPPDPSRWRDVDDVVVDQDFMMSSSHKSLHVDLNLVVALIHSCPQKWFRSCSVVVHINNAHVFRSNSSCIEPFNLLDACTALSRAKCSPQVTLRLALL